MIPTKSPLFSKTLWLAVITALVPLWPPAAALVAANPALASAAVGGLFAGLRLVSHGKISFSD